MLQTEITPDQLQHILQNVTNTTVTVILNGVPSKPDTPIPFDFATWVSEFVKGNGTTFQYRIYQTKTGDYGLLETFANEMAYTVIARGTLEHVAGKHIEYTGKLPLSLGGISGTNPAPYNVEPEIPPSEPDTEPAAPLTKQGQEWIKQQLAEINLRIQNLEACAGVLLPPKDRKAYGQATAIQTNYRS